MNLVQNTLKVKPLTTHPPKKSCANPPFEFPWVARIFWDTHGIMVLWQVKPAIPVLVALHLCFHWQKRSRWRSARADTPLVEFPLGATNHLGHRLNINLYLYLSGLLHQVEGKVNLINKELKTSSLIYKKNKEYESGPGQKMVGSPKGNGYYYTWTKNDQKWPKYVVPCRSWPPIFVNPMNTEETP